MKISQESFEVTRNAGYQLIRPDGDDTRRPILFLHGMGESADTFVQQHAKTIEASGRTWIIPNGAQPWERRRLGRMGYSWYFFLGDQQVLRSSMDDACGFLRSLLAQVSKEHHLNLPVSLLGFSQGGYLGSVFAADDATLVSAIGCIGGRLKHEFFAKRSAYAPMLQLHGDEDYSVSPELAREGVEAAKALGVDATMQTFAGVGHEISEGMLNAFLEWEQAL